MEKITGYIDHIIFRNEDNGYTVFQLNNEEGELTCVGKFSYIGEGEFLELEGEYTMHPSYGMQLQVTNHRIKEPEDRESIERYLGSGAVKGIGPALAGKIVAKFGEDTFRIMEEEPERLAEIRGRLERRERVEEESGRGNVGLKNIHDRIRLYYGDAYGIVIDSFPGKGTVVTLSYPSDEIPAPEMIKEEPI